MPRAQTVELHRPYIDADHHALARSVARLCTEYRRLSTAGSIPEQCHLLSIIIRLRIKTCLSSSSRLSLFPRLLTRPEDGSILCWQSLPCSSTRAPYENVIVLGHVQDENGQKMSKSKGNAVDPFDALQTYGADAIRWYFYINSAPWLPNRFHGKAVQEGQRKFMGTLWNTYAFFVLYANIDNFDATKYTLDYDKLTVMDKWILSKLNSTGEGSG